jgi:hypothetical protein
MNSGIGNIVRGSLGIHSNMARDSGPRNWAEEFDNILEAQSISRLSENVAHDVVVDARDYAAAALVVDVRDFIGGSNTGRSETVAHDAVVDAREYRNDTIARLSAKVVRDVCASALANRAQQLVDEANVRDFLAKWRATQTEEEYESLDSGDENSDGEYQYSDGEYSDDEN